MSAGSANARSAPWPFESLGELTRSTRPIAYGVLKPGPFVQDGVPLLRIQDLGGNVVSTTGFHRISRELDSEFARSRLRGGEVLLSIQGTIGRTAICPAHLAGANISRTIAVIDPDERLDARFLRLYLLHLRERGAYETSGSTRASLNIGTIRSMQVPLPPLAEQLQIVDILAEHLSRLDAAQAGITANRRRLERLRLSAASRALFSETPWRREPLAALLESTIGGLWGSPPGEEECDVQVLRVTEMRRDGTLDPSTAALRSVPERHLASRRLRAGDLLLEKSGGGPGTPVGRVGLVPELSTVSICSNFMQLMRPRREMVEPRFLHLYLRTFYLRGGTEPMQKATTNIRNLKTSEYVGIQVPVPDLATQQRIADEMDALLDGSSRLDVAVVAASQRGAALRRALLEAAFSGRLTGRCVDSELAEMLADQALAGT